MWESRARMGASGPGSDCLWLCAKIFSHRQFSPKMLEILQDQTSGGVFVFGVGPWLRLKHKHSLDFTPLIARGESMDWGRQKNTNVIRLETEVRDFSLVTNCWWGRRQSHKTAAHRQWFLHKYPFEKEKQSRDLYYKGEQSLFPAKRETECATKTPRVRPIFTLLRSFGFGWPTFNNRSFLRVRLFWNAMDVAVTKKPSSWCICPKIGSGSSFRENSGL